MTSGEIPSMDNAVAEVTESLARAQVAMVMALADGADRFAAQCETLIKGTDENDPGYWYGKGASAALRSFAEGLRGGIPPTLAAPYTHSPAPTEGTGP
jgi:hypothetical protein